MAGYIAARSLRACNEPALDLPRMLSVEASARRRGGQGGAVAEAYAVSSLTSDPPDPGFDPCLCRWQTGREIPGDGPWFPSTIARVRRAMAATPPWSAQWKPRPSSCPYHAVGPRVNQSIRRGRQSA